jgi:hypothetical protein
MWALLTPSTALAFSQVFSRLLLYFHGIQSYVSIAQSVFWSGFDSRQLRYQFEVGQGRKPWPALWVLNIWPLT